MYASRAIWWIKDLSLKMTEELQVLISKGNLVNGRGYINYHYGSTENGSDKIEDSCLIKAGECKRIVVQKGGYG
ncbi:MAG: hypothetical protein ACLSDJ_02540 [Butyricimonas faecihominis]